MSFWHGAGRLIGDLVLPELPGPHPVLLLVGADVAGRRDRSPWLDGLARAGVATFSWERPAARSPGGAGPGDRTATEGPDGDPRVRAREVLAAIERLCLLPEVDPGAIGLAGWGAGGWAAAQAATFDRRVRAVLLLSTPMMPCAPTVDPRPVLSGVTVPVLALYGEQDPLLPVEDSVRGVRSTLASAGHRDHEVAVVRAADHALRVRPGHGLGRMIDGLHQFGEWPAGLTEFVVGWLEGRLRPAAPIPSFVPPAALPTGARPPAPLLPDASPSAVLPSDRAVPSVSAAAPVEAAGSGADADPAARPEPGHGTVPVRQVRRRVTR